MDGFLNIHKTAGWTSHDVVAKIRQLLKISKVGHAGTLDPQATGVLPICLGKATKLAEFWLHTEKEYRTVMKLGEVTDTHDASGRILMRKAASAVSRELVEEALGLFVGRIQQIPPMYSAVKMRGQPLYKMARRGEIVDRPSREVQIYAIRLLEKREAEVSFDVVCSRGTYIRSLCADVGEKLGVGAHCLRLERRRYGPFQVEDAVTLEALEAAQKSGDHQRMVHGLGEVLNHLPELILKKERAEKAWHGVPIGDHDIQQPAGLFEKGDLFRVIVPQVGLVALAKALMGRTDTEPMRSRLPLFKIEKVLVGEEKMKIYNYTPV
jgi:tRNA pseudouridine55 synthase